MVDDYKISLTKDESGWWVATVPELPGCVSQGRTQTEARRNIREAIEPTLEDLADEPQAVTEGAAAQPL